MGEIYQYNDPLNFNELKLGVPKAVQGGGYYSNIKLSDEPLYIQTPKIYTKNGITVTGKRIYADLLFDRDDLDFISFINNIEDCVKKLIYEKRSVWFTEEPSIEDIEDNWVTSIKTYKNHKFLLRTNIEKNSKKISLQIWNQKEEEINITDIEKDSNIISIFEISGLKFSSTSFHLDIILKQIMKFEKVELFSKCLIKQKKPTYIEKIKSKSESENDDNESDSDDDSEDESDYNSDNSLDDDSLDKSTDNSDVTNETNNDVEKTDKIDEDETSNDAENTDKVDGNETTNDVETTDKVDENETTNDVETTDKVDETDTNNNDVIDNSENNVNSLENTTNDDNLENMDNSKNLEDVTEDNLKDENVELKENKEVKEKKTDNLEIINKEISDEIEKQKNDSSLEKNEDDIELSEVTLDVLNNNSEVLELRKPDDVYLEIYKKTLEKAREAKNQAIKAYLEAKKIKNEYVLDEMDSSDGEDLEDLSE